MHRKIKCITDKTGHYIGVYFTAKQLTEQIYQASYSSHIGPKIFQTYIKERFSPWTGKRRSCRSEMR